MRAMQPDLAGNLRVDQAWGSAQIMAAIHNDSGGYYTNVPGALGSALAGAQVFGHPAESWGWAVGGGAKFVNFLLPRDMLEFQVNYCHGAYAYCNIPGLYTQNWMYGRANTLAIGYAMDGIFNNGGQIQQTDIVQLLDWLPTLLEPAVEDGRRRWSGLQLVQRQCDQPALRHGSWVTAVRWTVRLGAPEQWRVQRSGA